MGIFRKIFAFRQERRKKRAQVLMDRIIGKMSTRASYEVSEEEMEEARKRRAKSDMFEHSVRKMIDGIELTEEERAAVLDRYNQVAAEGSILDKFQTLASFIKFRKRLIKDEWTLAKIESLWAFPADGTTPSWRWECAKDSEKTRREVE